MTISKCLSGKQEIKSELLANMATVLKTTSDYLLGIENDDGFNYYGTHHLLARNVHNLSQEQKLQLIQILFGECN